jgi:large subunit ribosomal protein L23
MATKKTTTEDKKVVEAKKLIIAPHITEKASAQSTANAYTFAVEKHATKLSLAAEIKATYKVTPIKINITNMVPQWIFSRGKMGKTAGMKKAIVFLKKGDTISLAN